MAVLNLSFHLALNLPPPLLLLLHCSETFVVASGVGFSAETAVEEQPGVVVLVASIIDCAVV